MTDATPDDPARRRSSRSRDARAVRSSVALRTALLTLLDSKPFGQIAIRDICVAAGIHYTTFFRHYETKEALLEDVATSEIRTLNGLAVEIRHGENYQAGIETVCRYVEERRNLWSTLLNGGAAGAMRAEWIEQAKRVASNELPVNSWLPTTLGTVCAAVLIAETLAWWVSEPAGAYSVEQVASILLRLISNAILSPD